MATIRFPASDGVELDGDLRFPEDADEHGGVAVVCHPHPSFGGSMDSWMIPVLQTALVEDGWVALRFDFRAVRTSGAAGTEDHGVSDVSGAVERVLHHGSDDGPALLIGWSYGAGTALQHALDDDRIGGWVGVALPVETTEDRAPDLRERLARWEVPKLFLHGAGDELTSVPQIEELVEAAAEPKRLRIIEGGDHLLTAYGDTLTEEVVGFARRLRGVEDEHGDEDR